MECKVINGMPCKYNKSLIKFINSNLDLPLHWNCLCCFTNHTVWYAVIVVSYTCKIIYSEDNIEWNLHTMIKVQTPMTVQGATIERVDHTYAKFHSSNITRNKWKKLKLYVYWETPFHSYNILKFRTSFQTTKDQMNHRRVTSRARKKKTETYNIVTFSIQQIF